MKLLEIIGAPIAPAILNKLDQLHRRFLRYSLWRRPIIALMMHDDAPFSLERCRKYAHRAILGKKMAATTQVDANVSEFRLNFTIVSTPLQHFWKAVDPPPYNIFFWCQKDPLTTFFPSDPPHTTFFFNPTPPIQHFRGGDRGYPIDENGIALTDLLTYRAQRCYRYRA